MKRILIVEDSQDVGVMLATFLRREGYQVDVETAAEEGLRRAAETQYDLGIIDLMMPHMNGFDVAEGIRKRDRLTPLLLVTGRDDDALVRGSARKAGFDDVIFKPIDPEGFLACVGRLADQARRGGR